MDSPVRPALNSTVVKLGLVSFFCDVASEMLYPITPIFLTSVLGASMVSLGLVEGLAEGLSSLLKTYSGSWSDTVQKRKPFIVVGYALGAISKPLIGLSSGWHQVLGAKLVDRTGKGIRTAPRDAMISESVDAAQRGAAFGWHRSMDTLGATVGPLIAIWLLTLNPENLRSLYFWAIIPGLISVVLVLSVREPGSKQNSSNWKNPFKTWSQQSQAFKNYIYAWAIFSLGNSSDVFLIMKAKSEDFSNVAVILLYCAFNLTYAVSSPYLGKLSDRIDRKKILVGGLLVFTLVYLGMGFANRNWHFWLLFLVYGLYMGATEGIGKALVVDLSDPSTKATSLGILGTVTGICTIVASLVAGLAWDHYGPQYTFFIGAVGALTAIFMLVIPIRRQLRTF